MKMEGLLNRRYLRVKAMQALYSKELNEGDLASTENKLFSGLSDIYQLFIILMSLIPEITDIAQRKIDIKREKKLATEEDLNPSIRFVDNPVISIIESNLRFKALREQYKVDWSLESDTLNKVWRKISEDVSYISFMNGTEPGFEKTKDLYIHIFKKHLGVNETLLDLMEDRNIHWYDDVQLAGINVVKTLSRLQQNQEPSKQWLPALYKNEKEDKAFIRELVERTVLKSDELQNQIMEHTKNWELDRIARLDIILMKMALCEFLYFPNLPVKVSLNEYLEISKNYSTTKSRIFINGVLDKLLADYKEKGLIKKVGRGLIEHS